MTQLPRKTGQICVSARGSMFCRGLLRKPMKFEKLRLLAKRPLGPLAAPPSGNRIGALLSRGSAGLAWVVGTRVSELGERQHQAGHQEDR